MAREPRLDPPDEIELPEPDQDSWDHWRLVDKATDFWEWITEDKIDELTEAIDTVLRAVGEAIKNGKDNKEDFAKDIGVSVIEAVEQYIKDGDLSDFVEDMKQKAADDFVEPDEPHYEPCPQFYDGTGKY